MRCRLPPQDLNKLTGREWVTFSVGRGWWGTESYEDHFELGKVSVQGDTATGVIVDYDGPTPFKFDFINDNGTWKLDFNRADELINQHIAEICREEGFTEMEASR